MKFVPVTMMIAITGIASCFLLYRAAYEQAFTAACLGSFMTWVIMPDGA